MPETGKRAQSWVSADTIRADRGLDLGVVNRIGGKTAWGGSLFRKLKVRYEKTTANSLALHHLAAAAIALRRCRSKTGKNIIYG